MNIKPESVLYGILFVFGILLVLVFSNSTKYRSYFLPSEPKGLDDQKVLEKYSNDFFIKQSDPANYYFNPKEKYNLIVEKYTNSDLQDFFNFNKEPKKNDPQSYILKEPFCSSCKSCGV